MYSFVVVVKDSHSDGLMESGEILVSVKVAELKLEVAKPALHEAVLPGARAFAAAERYLHSLTKFLVLAAQILAPLVAMEYRRAWIFTQGVEDSSERQLATVSGAEPPADDLSRFEIEHDR